MYQHHPVFLPHFYTQFMKPEEFWYFVIRPTRGPLNVIVNRNVGQIRKWVKRGRKIPISEGNVVVGYKQKLVFRNTNDVSTGWLQHEFSLRSEQFQPLVVRNMLDLPVEIAADDNQQFQEILNGYQQALGVRTTWRSEGIQEPAQIAESDGMLTVLQCFFFFFPV